MRQEKTRNQVWALLTIFILSVCVWAQNNSPLPTPPDVWNDYDPNAGDFKEQIVREETRGGVYYRDSYISAYVNEEEIRVYCLYAVKAGARKAPGLLNIHGWMSRAGIDMSYVNDGWAEMSYDYCGKTDDRPQFTKYPESMRYCNMDRQVSGGAINAQLKDGSSITDPRQTSDYVWYALQRRVLSYLLAQKEVDKSRIGAKGFSYGGTIIWNLGMDPRVKAIVAYFGIGWNVYYRDHAVWMYNVPYSEPPMTPGEKLYLSAVAPQAHVPYITAATLWLNGSNDHHGGFERGMETFKRFKPGVPWAFAVQARGHHNTDQLGDDCRLWLEKYVLDRNVDWPAHPQSEIRLDKDGVPELRITPASPQQITEVAAYYALKTPFNLTRNWRDTKAVREGDTWVAKMPVLNVNDYVFGYANIRYANTIVLSSDFEAAIPSTLGKAVATDKPSSNLSEGGTGMWSDVAPVEGAGGIKGFRPLNNQRGTASQQFSDPKWKAPPHAQLSFQFYCTEPQTLTLVADDWYETDLEITASDQWQQRVIPAVKLLHRNSGQPLADWSNVTSLQLKPKVGSDITKVIFANIKWIEGTNTTKEGQ